MGSGSGGYEVVIQHLEDAAKGYQAQMDNLQQAAAKFTSAANLPASAFGNLPQSGKLASEYQKFYDQVNSDVTKLWESVLSGALTLALNAVAYQAAEKQNEQAIAQIGT